MTNTPLGGVPRVDGASDLTPPALASMYVRTHEIPAHLRDWQLPPGWVWGSEGLHTQYRHYQEVVDALGRSLSLVTAPNSSHASWLESEARHLAHRNHPAVPTTYHYWSTFAVNRRGPGYLRRWIAGETVAARMARMGPDDVPGALRVLREIGSCLAYLHDLGTAHGCTSPETVWTSPMGRLWIMGWQWVVPATEIPADVVPHFRFMPVPTEWADGTWCPTPASDQWQLAATCFAALTGENPPPHEVPPIQLMRPDCPRALAGILDRALSADPEKRFPSVAALLRSIDRLVGVRTMVAFAGDESESSPANESPETRLRWALADDYEVLAKLGSGSFGSVWRVRDLTLGREAALKLLHPHVARDERIVGRFRREAKLAAQLAHPAIVPIFDWDSRGDVAWYTMELAEGGSVADLVARSGPRTLNEIAPQVDFVLNGLAAAHATGIVHRDLKPENVLIDRYGRWRLADFGIANMTGEEVAGASGTPAFAPPEQLLGEEQDAAADCFSLAAIVSYALSGTPPFGERDSAAILARELRGDVDLSAHPPELAAWLRHGLAASAEERFTDAATMQAAWREAVSTVLEQDRPVPWWRRWFSGDAADGGTAWTGESFFSS